MHVSLRRFARSIAVVFCASLSIALMGATTTSGGPALNSSASSSMLPTTTVVIFPFRLSDGVDPLVGTTFIDHLSGALKALGGVKVVMADPATAPADYLHVTKVNGGEYYLIGHISPPLHNTVPVIEQIVSGRSGTVVWSNTAYIAAEEDVLDQAPIIKTELVKYSTRGYLSILTATPRPAPPPPTPVAKKPIGPPENLPNEAYGYSSKPTAPPKIYASAGHPSRFVVLPFTGNTVTPAVRAYTIDAVMAAFKHRGQSVAEGNPETSQFPAVRGKDVCAQTGAGYLVFGTLDAKARPATLESNYIGWTDAYLTIYLYDCGAQKFEKAPKSAHGGGVSWKVAVDKATASGVSDYVMKVARFENGSS